MSLKSFTKQEAKLLRDLGVARPDFMFLDEQISIHQTTTANTRINFNIVVYKAAVEVFSSSPFQYTVNMTDTGQPTGKTLLNFIDWNV